MNIALMLYNYIDDDLSIETEVAPCTIFKSSNPNYLLALRDFSIELDRRIYFNREKIDWVLYTTSSNIKFDRFLAQAKYIESDNDTVYLIDDNKYPWVDGGGRAPAITTGFYCTPKCFSALGNAYKLKTPQHYHTVPDEVSTILYSLTRSGFNVEYLK